jgi:transglutaminase-like putative cysteine protease
MLLSLWSTKILIASQERSDREMNRGPDPELFLESCEIIDFRSPEVRRVAVELEGDGVTRTARRCFEFVRDEIKHSADHQLNPVTCRASDVLARRTGYCYAKSHLLCALLRANKVPAGLCYQRVTVADDKPPFCLHGLNAVYLAEYGWYRIDARGNREGIDAQFDPPLERLAFKTEVEGECDFPEIHVSPRPEIIRCLSECQTWEQVNRNLPDAVAASR